MQEISIKAKDLKKHFEQIIYHFQRGNATTEDALEQLSVQETKAIVFLGQRDEVIMREIADYLMVAVSTVTGLVDKLEDKNIVKRERSESDRRIINISLTERGHEIKSFHDNEFTKLCVGMLKGITDKEQDLYIELSKKIASNVRESFTRAEV